MLEEILVPHSGSALLARPTYSQDERSFSQLNYACSPDCESIRIRDWKIETPNK